MTWTITDKLHRAIFDELEAQTDRGTGIVGAALVEKRVSEAIESYLINNTATQELLSRSGALGDFGSKNNLAVSTGLYGVQTHREVDLIRRIRNDFAHFETPLEFDSPVISNRCKELWYPDHVEINGQPLNPPESRARFLRSINILNSILWAVIKRGKRRVGEPPSELP